ncbi:MAG: SAM domain-containing protein, partial [Burkholderiales bacterium]
MPQSRIAVWLEEIGLGQFARLFAKQQIEVEDLPELSEQDLEKLGIPLGPRKRLMKAIAGFNQAANRRQLTETAAQAFAPTDGERRQLTVLF